ncbi:MAG TPA: hypothetical protein VNA17_01910 [Pyrinomonadaceae bacterium]|nr:hypothetical protein [Pyrinomonadaceae bacterium]
MNSEELELSLRTEFENYLRHARAEMREQASEFQDRIEAEFERQKTQFDEAFLAFASCFDADPEFDEAFRGSVSEHLRIARDEGARIAAAATDDAVKMAQEAARAPKYDEIRDAVKDISSKGAQSAILKSLVSHAQEFAPRGAFFIIKSEYFVGWKVFGSGTESAESRIREIHCPATADSILAAATRSLQTVEAMAGPADTEFLDPLGFGRPGRMYAIPLVARHRGVAVLYADGGADGADVNQEALEILVAVAGLTVEMLASTQAAKAEDRNVSADFEDRRHDTDEHTAAAPPSYSKPQQAANDSPYKTTPDMAGTTPAFSASDPTAEFSFTESVTYEGDPQPVAPPQTFQTTPAEPTYSNEAFQMPAAEFRQHDQPATPPPGDVFDRAVTDPDTFPEPQPTEEPSGGSMKHAAAERAPFEPASEPYQPATAPGGAVFHQAPGPAPAVSASPRLSNRPVHLPIEVPDEERRIHNDARRFARLLVSEIKLYNEKKVMEGREAGDLYERLREAIDRSREMYDKRVQPPVAEKFDYFHYEIVNALAEGDSNRLGSSYPGSRV